MIWLTAIIAVATAINVIVFWLESEDTSKQIKTLSEKAGGIVDSMNTALSNNQGAITQAFVANKAAVDSSAKQAGRALDASIRASRTDQRSWISTVNERMEAEPSVGKDLVIRFDIANTGKTPGTHVTIKNQISVGTVEPTRPDWKSVMAKNSGVTFPGTSHRDITETIDGAKITQSLVDAYKAHNTMVYFRTRVDYRDVFGVEHWSEICGKHSFGQPLDLLDGCDSGEGEVDDNKE